MLDSRGIFRIVQDLCTSELVQSRRGAAAPAQAILDQVEHWDRTTVLLDRHRVAEALCLELDSLERISISAAINQFFRLHEWGVEDNLLRQKTLGDLAELVEAVVLDPEQPWRGLTVTSSGTTGEPKRILQSREALEAEAASWAARLPSARRVLSLIPSHHLYGLIWTVLWPGHSGHRVEDARHWSAGRWQREMTGGDVIVAVPVQWENLLRSLDHFPAGVTGISSAGRLAETAWSEAKRQGLTEMIEVYGSTETGGVATRNSHTEPFRLAPHWETRREQLDELLPDWIESVAPDTFQVRGRKDGAVKVAGVLVHLPDVEAALLEIDGVLECRVRLSRNDAQARLEACIATAVPADQYAEFETQIHRSLSDRLAAAAIPRRYQFVEELPRNGMGKVVSW